jgi:hypothetical protein
MAFSDAVSQKALIACKRRCCLCEVHCGKKMHLHHIIHKSAGGDDSFGNCIPLCFNCHDDMGHDPKHSLGRKYSAPELTERRDNWYSLVVSGKLDLGSSAFVQDIARQRQRSDLQKSLILGSGQLEALACECYALRNAIPEPVKRKMSALWRSVKADIAVIRSVWNPENFGISTDQMETFDRDFSNFLSGSNVSPVDFMARSIGETAASWRVVPNSGS